MTGGTIPENARIPNFWDDGTITEILTCPRAHKKGRLGVRVRVRMVNSVTDTRILHAGNPFGRCGCARLWQVRASSVQDGRYGNVAIAKYTVQTFELL